MNVSLNIIRVCFGIIIGFLMAIILTGCATPCNHMHGTFTPRDQYIAEDPNLSQDLNYRWQRLIAAKERVERQAREPYPETPYGWVQPRQTIELELR